MEPAPSGAMELQILKPKTQGRERTIINTRFTATALPPFPTEQVYGKADDIFKYRYNGGKGGEAHKYKEQGSENPSAGHLVEDIGQGY